MDLFDKKVKFHSNHPRTTPRYRLISRNANHLFFEDISRCHRKDTPARSAESPKKRLPGAKSAFPFLTTWRRSTCSSPRYIRSSVPRAAYRSILPPKPLPRFHSPRIYIRAPRRISRTFSCLLVPYIQYRNQAPRCQLSTDANRVLRPVLSDARAFKTGEIASHAQNDTYIPRERTNIGPRAGHDPHTDLRPCI